MCAYRGSQCQQLESDHGSQGPTWRGQVRGRAWGVMTEDNEVGEETWKQP